MLTPSMVLGMEPDDRAMAKNRKAKNEQTMGAILRIMPTISPPPPRLGTPLMLESVIKKGVAKSDQWVQPLTSDAKERLNKETA